jgi:ribulose-phosphate 3-epimerase
MTDPLKTPEIIPSLFATDPLRYCDALKAVERFGCRRIHLDIMDGHFVPNISFGTNIIAAVAKEFPRLFREVHLMVQHPQRHLEALIKSGAQRLFIHIELTPEVLKETIRCLQSEAVDWGFAVNPETPLETLQTYQDWILNTQHLLLMSVHPGFCGQTFIEEIYERLKELRACFPHLKLCIDGGIRTPEAQRLQALGAESVVMGSAFFKKVSV